MRKKSTRLFLMLTRTFCLNRISKNAVKMKATWKRELLTPWRKSFFLTSETIFWCSSVPMEWIYLSSKGSRKFTKTVCLELGCLTGFSGKRLSQPKSCSLKIIRPLSVTEKSKQLTQQITLTWFPFKSQKTKTVHKPIWLKPLTTSNTLGWRILNFNFSTSTQFKSLKFGTKGKKSTYNRSKQLLNQTRSNKN